MLRWVRYIDVFEATFNAVITSHWFLWRIEHIRSTEVSNVNPQYLYSNHTVCLHASRPSYCRKPYRTICLSFKVTGSAGQVSPRPCRWTARNMIWTRNWQTSSVCFILRLRVSWGYNPECGFHLSLWPTCLLSPPSRNTNSIKREWALLLLTSDSNPRPSELFVFPASEFSREGGGGYIHICTYIDAKFEVFGADWRYTY